MVNREMKRAGKRRNSRSLEERLNVGLDEVGGDELDVALEEVEVTGSLEEPEASELAETEDERGKSEDVIEK